MPAAMLNSHVHLPVSFFQQKKMCSNKVDRSLYVHRMEDESSSQAGNKRERTKNETLKQEGSPVFILLFFYYQKEMSQQIPGSGTPHKCL